MSSNHFFHNFEEIIVGDGLTKPGDLWIELQHREDNYWDYDSLCLSSVSDDQLMSLKNQFLWAYEARLRRRKEKLSNGKVNTDPSI